MPHKPAKPQTAAPSETPVPYSQRTPKLIVPTTMREAILPAPILVVENLKELRGILRKEELPRTPVLFFWDVLSCDWRAELNLTASVPAKTELLVRAHLTENSNCHRLAQTILTRLAEELKAFFVRRERLLNGPYLHADDKELSAKAARKRQGSGRGPKICKEFLTVSEEIRKVLSKILGSTELRYASAPDLVTRRPLIPTPMVVALDLTTKQLTIMTEWQWQEKREAREFRPHFLTHKFHLAKGMDLSKVAPSVRQALCQGLKVYQTQLRSGMEPVGYDHAGHVSYLFESVRRYKKEEEFTALEDL